MKRRFDLFGWVVSLDRKRATYAAYTSLLVGPLLLAHFVYRMTQIPWELNNESPVAISIGGGCDANGGVYPIEVRGTVYQCGGGDMKCATESDAKVAYVQDRPRRCRLLRNVGRPSLYELDELLLGLIVVSFGGAAICWDAAWIERLAASDGNPAPSLAYVMWRAAFWFSALAFAVIGLWQYARFGAVF